jgi:hypothetical protein
MPFVPGHNLGFNCFLGGGGHKRFLMRGIKLKLEDFIFHAPEEPVFGTPV